MDAAAPPPPTPPNVGARSWRSDSGFTIVEVLVAATLLIVGAFATLALLDNGTRTTSVNKQRDVANETSQELIERATGGRYSTVRNDMTDVDVAGSAVGPADRMRLALGDATTAVSPATLSAPASPPVAPPAQSWSLLRGGTTFRVTYAACTLSDRIDGVEVKGPYDCQTSGTGGTTGGGGGGTTTPTTSNGCTVATTPVSASGSSGTDVSAGAVAVSLQLLGYLGLKTCLDLGNLTNALSPAVCSLATAGALGAPLASLVGANGLLGGLARVNAGVGNCPALVEPTLKGPVAGAATTTRVSVSIAWTDRQGRDQRIDRTSVVRRPA